MTNFSRHQQQQQRETVDDVRQSVSVGTVAAEAALSQKTLQVEEITVSSDEGGSCHGNGDATGAETGCELIGEESVASSNSNSNNDDVDDDDDFVVERTELGDVWNDHEDHSSDGPPCAGVTGRSGEVSNTADDDMDCLKTTITSNVNNLSQNARLSTEVLSPTSQVFDCASDVQQFCALSLIHI